MSLETHACPRSAQEERALVSRMRRGDEDAFETFARCYLEGLYRFAARRLGHDRELAREIAQATACRVLAKLDTYRGEAPLFTWLCACCRNEIAAHYRRQERRPRTVALEPDEDTAGPSARLDPAAPDPEESLLLLEANEAVHLALDSLSPTYARVLEWRYLEDADVGEIARRLDGTYKSAESLLSRARRAFRDAYERLLNAAVGAEIPARGKRAAP